MIYSIFFSFWLREGVYKVKKTYSYLYLISLNTNPTVARREIRPKTDTDTPIIIFGSWFDDSAAVVCVVVGSGVVGMVDEVDVSVIRSGGGPCLKIISKQIWFTKFLVKYT